MDPLLGISTDVLSSMYQYMTPRELYERKNLNPLWYRRYLEVLPQWATTIEPWFIAAQTGDMQLLDDLLAVAEPPSAYDEELDIEKEQIINGIKYEEDAYGAIELALDNGKHDIALKLARKYEENLFDPSYDFKDIIQRIAMFDDDFLRRYLQDIADIVNGFHNYYDRSTRLLIRAYNKGFIDDNWLANILNEIESERDLGSIILAHNFSNIYRFQRILEPFSKNATRRRRKLEREARNIT